VILKVATAEELQQVTAFKLAKKRTEPAHFDPNGFNQQILALTSVGKLFALHSSDGRILWAKNYGQLSTFADMWVYKQHSLHRGIEVALVSKLKASGDETAMLSTIDGWTGEILTKRRLRSASSSVVKLQPAGPSSLQAALLVDYQAGKADVLAEEEAVAEILQGLQSTYVFNVDEDEHAASGYMLASSKDQAEALTLTNLWRFKVPSGDKIVGFGSPNYFQNIYSRTRVLGDRSALYKYTNPNTLFVAAESEGDSGSPKITVYLLDTVTGKLLYSITHKDAQGPVHVVFHEHWIVYKYWNTRANRDEMSVMELYEDEPLKNSMSVSSYLFDLVTKANQTSTVSSYNPLNLRVLGQSYVLSTGLKTMTVTSSSLGMTANQVLVGTLSDQVYAIDKKLLDPRRPVKPSAADKEEGLIPYNEFLPIAPQKFVTHTHQVMGLKEIQCFPTRRESSILMLAHGIDVFYTRLMPSKSFDMLEDDFSYSLLVTTILGLLIAAFVVNGKVKKDNVKRNWV